MRVIVVNHRFASQPDISADTFPPPHAEADRLPVKTRSHPQFQNIFFLIMQIQKTIPGIHQFGGPLHDRLQHLFEIQAVEHTQRHFVERVQIVVLLIQPAAHLPPAPCQQNCADRPHSQDQSQRYRRHPPCLVDHIGRRRPVDHRRIRRQLVLAQMESLQLVIIEHIPVGATPNDGDPRRIFTLQDPDGDGAGGLPVRQTTDDLAADHSLPKQKLPQSINRDRSGAGQRCSRFFKRHEFVFSVTQGGNDQYHLFRAETPHNLHSVFHFFAMMKMKSDPVGKLRRHCQKIPLNRKIR